ncbi:MAG: hypothetical protein R3A52_32100 [Polyangiales bacterium]
MTAALWVVSTMACVNSGVVATRDGGEPYDFSDAVSPWPETPRAFPVGEGPCANFHANPEDRASCSLPGRTTCVFTTSIGWTECTCGCSAERRWSCFSTNGSEGFGMACPARMPADGSDCAGRRGSGCYYFPGYVCRCPPVGSEAAWSCQQTPLGIQLPACVVRADVPDGVAPPSNVDPRRRIEELTDEEVTAWCEWFVSANIDPHLDPPLDQPVREDGTADYGSAYCGPPLDLCMPQVTSVNHCRQNLRRRACRATVEALSDCALTFRGRCTLHGRGCGPLRVAEGCDETLAQTVSDRGCPLPVR